MNLIDCEVLEITSPPTPKEHKGQKWVQVGIRYTSYGVEGCGTEVFKDMASARRLKVGDIVQR